MATMELLLLQEVLFVIVCSNLNLIIKLLYCRCMSGISAHRCVWITLCVHNLNCMTLCMHCMVLGPGPSHTNVIQHYINFCGYVQLADVQLYSYRCSSHPQSKVKQACMVSVTCFLFSAKLLLFLSLGCTIVYA